LGNAAGDPLGNPFRIDDLLIDSGTQRVFRDGAEIALPKLSFDLLMALTRAAPNTVSQEELIRQVWIGLVVSPETVTQRVKLLRDALSDDSQSPRYVGLVRGRGYRLLPTPVSVATAPEKVLKAAAGPRPSRRIRYGLYATLATLLAAAVIWLTLGTGTEPPIDAAKGVRGFSIGVLPIDSLSPEAQEHDYFAAGMHDDLLTHLSQIEGLRVISRSSMLTYRAGDHKIPEIAEELGITHVLEGSVQQVGRQVRVNVQLIDAKLDTHVWAKKYDRDFSAAQILDIQEDIARSVADAMRLTLLTDSTAPLGITGISQAYGLYLTGNGYRQTAYDHYVSADFGRLLQIAEDHYRRALALDPDFALAYAALARVLAEIFWHQARPGAEAAIAEARVAAERSLQLLPELAEGHMGLAYYYYYGLRDYRRALEEIALAEARMPANAGILTTKMYLLRRLGRLNAYVETAGQAMELAPGDLMIASQYAWGLSKQWRLDEAEAVYTRLEQINPDSGKATLGSAMVKYLRSGEIEPLAAAAALAAEENPDTAWLLNWIAGNLKTSRDIVRRTQSIELSDSPAVQLKLGLTELSAGNQRLAYEQLEQARVLLEAKLAEASQAEPERYLSQLAVTLAALGRKDAAIEAGRSAVVRVPVEKDSLAGPRYLLDLALVYGSFGETDLALSTLEKAVSQPFAPQPWEWQHDPRLESARQRPEFRELVARYGAPAQRDQRGRY